MAAKTTNLREAWVKWKRRVRVDLIHQLPLRGTQKVILGRICDCLGLNEWAWPAIDWLAKEAGCCERTVQNILSRLLKLNLIEVTERFEAKTGRQMSNYVRIVWQTVGRLTQTPPLSVMARPAKLSTTVAPAQKFLPSAPVAGGGCNPCGGRVQPVAGGGCNLDAPLEPIRRAIGTSNERHWSGNGDFQSTRDGSAIKTGIDKVDTPDAGRSPSGGWPTPITLESLKDRLLLTLNFHHAKRRGWVHEDDEARFKTLAASIVDRFEHPPPGHKRIRNVGATFTKCVKRRLWFGSAKHEQTAIGKPKRAGSVNP